MRNKLLISISLLAVVVCASACRTTKHDKDVVVVNDTAYSSDGLNESLSDLNSSLSDLGTTITNSLSGLSASDFSRDGDVYNMDDGTYSSSDFAGPSITRTYNLRDFDGFVGNGSFYLNYVQGNHYSVKVTTSKTAFDKLKLSVNNGKLTAEFKSKSINVKYAIRIDVTSPYMNSVKNSGSLTFKAGNMNADYFSIENRGAFEMTVGKIRCTSFSSNNSGAITLNGDVDAARNISFDEHGALTLKGNYNAKGDVKMTISGAVDARS
jgi:hypothetical protein